MTVRSKMSSAISTTDSTEEPNHRLHWLPRLDRRVTIWEGERHADPRGEELRPSSPEAFRRSSQPLRGPLGPFCARRTQPHTPFLPPHPQETSSPSRVPLLLTLSASPSLLAPFPGPCLQGPGTLGPQRHPRFSLTAAHLSPAPREITGSLRQHVQ